MGFFERVYEGLKLGHYLGPFVFSPTVRQAFYLGLEAGTIQTEIILHGTDPLYRGERERWAARTAEIKNLYDRFGTFRKWVFTMGDNAEMNHSRLEDRL